MKDLFYIHTFFTYIQELFGDEPKNWNDVMKVGSRYERENLVKAIAMIVEKVNDSTDSSGLGFDFIKGLLNRSEWKRAAKLEKTTYIHKQQLYIAYIIAFCFANGTEKVTELSKSKFAKFLLFINSGISFEYVNKNQRDASLEELTSELLKVFFIS